MVADQYWLLMAGLRKGFWLLTAETNIGCNLLYFPPNVCALINVYKQQHVILSSCLISKSRNIELESPILSFIIWVMQYSWVRWVIWVIFKYFKATNQNTEKVGVYTQYFL